MSSLYLDLIPIKPVFSVSLLLSIIVCYSSGTTLDAYLTCSGRLMWDDPPYLSISDFKLADCISLRLSACFLYSIDVWEGIAITFTSDPVVAGAG